jgi:hypothetical protein
MADLVTKKGTTLPIMKLKGKDYMLVAWRLVWLNEDVSRFTINTEFLQLTEEYTIAKATIYIYDDAGNLVKSASATKRETKKDFADHTEKAETGAIGRCVANLGFGTSQALVDLDEGVRIVDAPLTHPSKDAAKPATSKPAPVVTGTELAANLSVAQPEPATQAVANTPMPSPKKSTFRKPSTTPATDGGWK